MHSGFEESNPQRSASSNGSEVIRKIKKISDRSRQHAQPEKNGLVQTHLRPSYALPRFPQQGLWLGRGPLHVGFVCRLHDGQGEALEQGSSGELSVSLFVCLYQPDGRMNKACNRCLANTIFMMAKSNKNKFCFKIGPTGSGGTGCSEALMNRHNRTDGVLVLSRGA